MHKTDFYNVHFKKVSTILTCVLKWSDEKKYEILLENHLKEHRQMIF